MKAENVPTDVIEAIKKLNSFINKNQYLGLVVLPEGGIQLYTGADDYEYISPIALDMAMFSRWQRADSPEKD